MAAGTSNQMAHSSFNFGATDLLRTILHQKLSLPAITYQNLQLRFVHHHHLISKNAFRLRQNQFIQTDAPQKFEIFVIFTFLSLETDSLRRITSHMTPSLGSAPFNRKGVGYFPVVARYGLEEDLLPFNYDSPKADYIESLSTGRLEMAQQSKLSDTEHMRKIH
ncbi:hypothetical protein KIN20_037573 [Parelaphostrongylus tenuis]|uniref:Uncharacterized protein n=1 Tax=Parelaphostrongylus tenuis TaxID=148309 RepID=A0AAD5RER9_PARTN|nr:hypothetical protein KIN20_037573 [Parelaphostrongylus tenuis]